MNREDYIQAAADAVCREEQKMAKLLKRMTTARAVQVILRDAGWDLTYMHREGILREVLHIFL